MCCFEGQKTFFYKQKSAPRKSSLESTDDQKSIEKLLKQNRDSGRIKYKTELCKNYSENGFCRYGKKCRFAHGVRELKRKDEGKNCYYRTKRCQSFWLTGECSYGVRCQFSHGEGEIDRELLRICEKALCEGEGDGACSRLFTLLG